MKIEHDEQHIYLYFEREDFIFSSCSGRLQPYKETLAELKGVLGTPTDPEAEEVMHYDGNIRAWVFEYSRETIDKLRELVGTATPSKEKR